jgi:hypothetical protein
VWLTAAAGDERRQAAYLLSAFRAALAGLLIGLLLMLRPILHLLIARREWLGIARQIRLLLRFARRVAWFVLTHERLGVIIVALKALVAALLSAGRALLLMRLLLVVVGVLLTELFLRGCNQTEIMFGMLVVILGCYRVAGTLRVARKLDIFFRNVRSGAADLYIGTVRFINTRERILAFAVVAASPHSLLTVSHDVPVRRPFPVSRCSAGLQVHTSLIARLDLHHVRANDRIVAFLSR